MNDVSLEIHLSPCVRVFIESLLRTPEDGAEAVTPLSGKPHSNGHALMAASRPKRAVDLRAQS
jgi:hypothetical protein